MKKFLERFGIKWSKTVQTPLTMDFKVSEEQSPKEIAGNELI